MSSHATIDDSTHDMLKELKRVHGMSYKYVCNKAIRDFFDRIKREKNQNNI